MEHKMNPHKEKLINGIIDVEGGYSDNPNDSGGKTCWGITESVARQNGYTGAMQFLPRDFAFGIYEAKYWHGVMGEYLYEIDPDLAHEVVDTAINMGVWQSSIFLQRWLNVMNRSQELYMDIVVDGKIGNKTISALKAYASSQRKIDALRKGLNCSQGAKYLQLAEDREKDEKYVYGWVDKRC
jgi:lysozyme family protein